MMLARETLFKIGFTNIIFIFSLPTVSLKNDYQKPIQINSVKQLLNFKRNITTFTENVVIKQGSIDIKANKVIILCPNRNTKKIIVEAYGNPVVFCQLQDNSKPIKGYSDKIRYETERKLIILTGHAYFGESNSSIIADKITYLAQTKQIEAFSNKGKRVITTLLPYRL